MFGLWEEVGGGTHMWEGGVLLELYVFISFFSMVEDKGGKWNMLLECLIHYTYISQFSIFWI